MPCPNGTPNSLTGTASEPHLASGEFRRTPFALSLTATNPDLLRVSFAATCPG